jgi:TolB-like protein
MKKSLLAGLLACAGILSAASAGFDAASVYIAPVADGFDGNIVAALQKKQVPVAIVPREDEARYVLRPSAIDSHNDSRCALFHCINYESSGVSVQLIDRQTSRVVWAYEVAKAFALSSKNRQSMAESIAKHLRKEFFQAK